jgi:L-fucose mutarotase
MQNAKWQDKTFLSFCILDFAFCILHYFDFPNAQPLPRGERGDKQDRQAMLKHHLIHPKINEILGRAGHHARVLIADGNYPASTTLGPNAELISLNLAPGVVNCSQVLTALLTAVPIDAVNTMGIPPDDPYAMQGEPPIWNDYRRILAAAGLKLELQPIDKWKFYEAVVSRDHVLTIQTAEQALWANVLLTVGCRTS